MNTEKLEEGRELCGAGRSKGVRRSRPEEQGVALSSTLQKAATLAKLSGLPESEPSEADW